MGKNYKISEEKVGCNLNNEFTVEMRALSKRQIVILPRMSHILYHAWNVFFKSVDYSLDETIHRGYSSQFV